MLSSLYLIASVALAPHTTATEQPEQKWADDGPGISFRIETRPANLEAAFTTEQLALLEKLNRADRNHLRRLQRLVVPDRWDGHELDYSPLPREVGSLMGHPKALVVHQPTQVFGAYEHGRLVHWGPVSTGTRATPTPSGEYSLNWRSRARTSTVDRSWHMEWYFNFHNERGLAFHQYALPGRPASNACVRLLERDARWIYAWGEGWRIDEGGWAAREPGTPVWIIGRYDFGSPPPWLAAGAPHPPIEIQL